MGLISTYIYTSEFILCFTICVHSATRHNIRFEICSSVYKESMSKEVQNKFNLQLPSGLPVSPAFADLLHGIRLQILLQRSAAKKLREQKRPGRRTSFGANFGPMRPGLTIPRDIIE